MQVTLTTNVFYEGYQAEGTVLDVSDEAGQSLIESGVAVEGASSEGAANASAPLADGSQVAGDSPAPTEPTEPTDVPTPEVTPVVPEATPAPEATQIPVTEVTEPAPTVPAPQVQTQPTENGQPSPDEISDTLNSIQ